MEEMLFTFWVTDTCNLQCKYCYEGNKKNYLFMTQQIAEQSIQFVIKKLKEHQTKSCRIVFHGGEPTLNIPIIKYVIDRFSKLGNEYCIHYGMTTNCYSISEEDINYLSDKIDDLTVSIDGCEKSHNLNRINAAGKGTYDKVIKTAMKFNSRHAVRVRMTVNTSNSYMLYENIKSIISKGFTIIIPGIDYGDNNWEQKDFELLQNEFEKVRELQKSIDKDVYVSSMSVEEISKKTICDGCISSFHINADGNIYPCVYVTGDLEFCMGNVFDNINTEKLCAFNKINAEHISACIGCNYYDYCPSKRCKYINKKLTGDFLTPSPIVCATENMLLKLSGVTNH